LIDPANADAGDGDAGDDAPLADPPPGERVLETRPQPDHAKWRRRSRTASGGGNHVVATAVNHVVATAVNGTDVSLKPVVARRLCD
jgi:hypothetical protein